MSERPAERHIEDWAILKYGWLFIFLVHVVFLLAGVKEIREALEFFSPELLNPADRRLDHVIQAIYMVTISFSILLLVVAIFALEIFRTQRKILRLLTQQGDQTGTGPVPAGGPGEGDGLSPEPSP